MQVASFQTDTEINRIILFLHGYGANGEDLLNIGQYWKDDLPHTLLIAPNAPYPHPHVPNGFMWFDFADTSDITPGDLKNGLDAVRPILQDYLQTLVKTYGVTLSQIIPVGFSQGAMIALDLLTYEPEIRSVIEYAGIYYPMSQSIENASSKRALLVHGTDDTIVPYPHMKQAEKALTALGVRVTSVTCAGLGHSISTEGITAGKNFLKEIS